MWVCECVFTALSAHSRHCTQRTRRGPCFGPLNPLWWWCRRGVGSKPRTWNACTHACSHANACPHARSLPTSPPPPIPTTSLISAFASHGTSPFLDFCSPLLPTAAGVPPSHDDDGQSCVPSAPASPTTTATATATATAIREPPWRRHWGWWYCHQLPNHQVMLTVLKRGTSPFFCIDTAKNEARMPHGGEV